MDMRAVDRSASAPVTAGNAVILASVQTLVLAAAENDLSLPAMASTAVYRCTPAGGGSSVSGIVAATLAQLLLLWNLSDTDQITLLHESALSVAGNRFLLPGATDLVIDVLAGRWIWFDTVTGRWRVVG